MTCVFSLQIEMPFTYLKNGMCSLKEKKNSKQCRNTEAEMPSASAPTPLGQLEFIVWKVASCTFLCDYLHLNK